MTPAPAPVQRDTTTDTRPAYYCQNPNCAGVATYPSTCCGMPMVTR